MTTAPTASGTAVHEFTPSKPDYERCKVCYEQDAHPNHRPTRQAS